MIYNELNLWLKQPNSPIKLQWQGLPFNQKLTVVVDPKKNQNEPQLNDLVQIMIDVYLTMSYLLENVADGYERLFMDSVNLIPALAKREFAQLKQTLVQSSEL